MAFKTPRPSRRRKPKQPKTPPRQDVPELTPEYLIDLAGRSNSLKELRLIWANTKDMGMLAEDVQHAILTRAAHLTEIGVTE